MVTLGKAFEKRRDVFRNQWNIYNAAFFCKDGYFHKKSFIADIQLLSKYATEGGLPISCSENWKFLGLACQPAFAVTDQEY